MLPRAMHCDKEINGKQSWSPGSSLSNGQKRHVDSNYHQCGERGHRVRLSHLAQYSVVGGQRKGIGEVSKEVFLDEDTLC